LTDRVEWLVVDVTTTDLPARVKKSIKPGGHVIIGTFGPEGHTKCSGLDVSSVMMPPRRMGDPSNPPVLDHPVND
jgi:hypothetical protein